MNTQKKSMDFKVLEQDANRLVMAFGGSIKAAPENIFPLLCPKREDEWIEGWSPGASYEMVYTKSGVNEKNCIFNEFMLKRLLFGQDGLTTWVTTAFSSENHCLEFHLFFGGLAVLNRNVRVKEEGPKISRVTWTDTLTLVEEPAKAMDRELLIRKMKGFSLFLGLMLRFHCETGQILEISAYLRGEEPVPLSPEDSELLKAFFA